MTANRFHKDHSAYRLLNSELSQSQTTHNFTRIPFISSVIFSMANETKWKHFIIKMTRLSFISSYYNDIWKMILISEIKGRKNLFPPRKIESKLQQIFAKFRTPKRTKTTAIDRLLHGILMRVSKLLLFKSSQWLEIDPRIGRVHWQITQK